MKNTERLSILTLSTALLMGLSACATQQTASLAMQRENNQFEVTGIGKDKITAENNAIKAAQSTCKRHSPIVTNQSTQYNGTLDEKTGQIINQAGAIAKVFIGKNVNVSQDTDYSSTLTFYCKS